VLDWQGYKYYFFAEETTGARMNDAIYERKIFVEDELNIKMTTVKNPDLGGYCSEVKTVIAAGDDAYDMLFNHCIQDIATFVTEGYLYNLDFMPHIDMKAEWWNSEQMDILRLGDNTYYAVNDMMIPCPAVILFNKDMISAYDLANPYELVYNGDWTLDNMETIARAVTADIKGDCVMDINDQYGLAATSRGSSCCINFMTGSDQFITDVDSDGKVHLAFNTEKTQSIMERFAALSKENVIYNAPSGDAADQVWMDTNRLMFQILYLAFVEDFRDCEVDFGILPYPKYDAAQDNYYNLDWGGLLSVPTTITNPDMVGAAMELLAWDSANGVIPAFYDQVLDGQLARDEESTHMLDIFLIPLHMKSAATISVFPAVLMICFIHFPDWQSTINPRILPLFMENSKNLRKR